MDVERDANRRQILVGYDLVEELLRADFADTFDEDDDDDDWCTL